jgi:flagellar brake protein
MPDDHSEVHELQDADSERFQVHSRLEIIAILRSVIEHRAFVTATFGEGNDFIVTALLAMNPDFEELIFDYGADAQANKRLVGATLIELSMELDHIKILFSVQRAEATTFEDGPAFRIRMPASITRLQRRDNYRVRLPLSQPATCTLHCDPARPAASMAIRIFDVSCGGLALIDYPADLQLVPGTVYKDCQLDLREIGRVSTDIEIMHVMEKVSKNSLRSRICGCRFKNMANASVTLIQRYINKIERGHKVLT